MSTIRNATKHDIPAIQMIAEETWWPTYSPILTKEQIRFMLDQIYSSEALEDVMNNGQSFILLEHEGKPEAFAAFGLRKENNAIAKLHKIYVRPTNHKKGYGQKLVDEVVNRIKEQNIFTLDLNVNRFNAAKSFYERLGFVVIGEEDVPIGPYFMNDYVMRLQVDKPS